MLKETNEIKNNRHFLPLKPSILAIESLDSKSRFSVSSKVSDSLTIENRSIMTILEDKRCIKNMYTDEEAFTICEYFTNEWCTKYYEHPIWKKLASGFRLNQFVTWLMQNYHLSKSKLVTDSRCAVFLPNKELRNLFKQDLTEKYWHNDLLHFVDHSMLAISTKDFKNNISLRSSLAFEQQMIRLAEEDSLGYIIVSYFWENKVASYENYKNFYQDIEESYSINGFFNIFKQQSSITSKYDPMQIYSDIFLEFDQIKKKDLLNSFKNAALTIGYLFEMFDEILSQPLGNNIFLRTSANGESTAEVLKIIFGKNKNHISMFDINKFKDHIDLSEHIINNYLENNSKKFDHSSLDQRNLNYIEETISHSAFRSLGFASEHDEISMLEFIAKHLKNYDPFERVIPKKLSEWTAITNYLYESAYKPKIIILLFFYLNNLFRAVYGSGILPIAAENKLEEFIKHMQPVNLDYIKTIVLLLENFNKFVTSENTFYKFNVLS